MADKETEVSKLGWRAVANSTRCAMSASGLDDEMLNRNLALRCLMLGEAHYVPCERESLESSVFA
jgi:hypothetical protein